MNPVKNRSSAPGIPGRERKKPVPAVEGDIKRSAPSWVDHETHNREDGQESARHQSGEWTHPVTNHDEQKKVTNTGNQDAMGEHEREGI